METQHPLYWKILLIGDHCVDVYHYGECQRLSPEAPVPILKVFKTETKNGMSSNVYDNLKSFDLIVDHVKSTSASEKHRLIDNNFNYHLLRYDVGENTLVDEIDLNTLKSSKDYDAVIISDYDKGFIRHESALKICDIFKDTPIFVDSKKKNLSCYSNCYVKVNEHEYNNLTKKSDSASFIVTLGDKGAMYNGKTYVTNDTEVFDVCGAGDVFLSALVYFYLKTGSVEESIPHANKCASFSVSKLGTYVLTKGDINDLCF